MFEAVLLTKFKKVFEVDRARYDSPVHDAPEQDTLFIEIDEAKSSIKNGKALAKVKGKATIFAQNDKLPFGFFAKRIAAHPDDTLDLFFYDIEENTRLHNNLVQRGFSFIYFFNSQYDPAIGTLTSVTTEVEI